MVNIGALPDASEKGRGDKRFSSLCRDLFGRSPDSGVPLARLRSNGRGGAVYECNNNDSLTHLISRLFPRDFAVLSCPADAPKALPRVMHRRMGARDVYAIYNLAAGTECFFRSKGKAELWNPATGERSPLYMIRHSKEGTTVRLPLSQHEVQVIVFGPGGNEVTVETSTFSAINSVSIGGGNLTIQGESVTPGRTQATVKYKGKVVRLEGERSSGRVSKPVPGGWDFEVHPVLDNRWGDYHWPPTSALIGPEVRRFAYTETDSVKAVSGDTVSCSFGPQFWKLGPLPEMIPNDALLKRGMIDPHTAIVLNGRSYAWQPYRFSWRWGVEDDPGHQGYHGLKEEVYDEFIRLGKAVHPWPGAPNIERQAEEGGNFYCLFAGVISPAEGMYTVRQGAVRPRLVVLNGVPVETDAASVRLKAGTNMLLLWYDRHCTTYFVLQAPGSEKTAQVVGVAKGLEGKPLAMRWYADTTILRFDTRFNDEDPKGRYTFTSAPGMRRMRFAAHGDVEVLVGGKPVRVTKGALRSDGATAYNVELEETMARPADVVVRVAQERGYYGGAAIPGPVVLDCGVGMYETGDWSNNDALYAYSGGAKYRRSVSLSRQEAMQKVELNLGSVVSSAEVWINGRNAGVKTAPPWIYDISTYVHEGDNSVEVLVYNTAANHYTSIPTKYRGSITSGLLGPVTLDFTGRVVLQGSLRSSTNSK